MNKFQFWVCPVMFYRTKYRNHIRHNGFLCKTAIAKMFELVCKINGGIKHFTQTIRFKLLIV